jgi:PAS domain S-box-containing protein
MPAQYRAAPSKARRANKLAKAKAARNKKASAHRAARELILAAMEKNKGKPRLSKRFSPNGSEKAQGHDGTGAAAVFQHPKTELEAAIQRYVNLFDFAPIGYVTFDRVGRIEEINIAATHLLNRTRENLIGSPFAVCVAKSDAQLFLHHLLHCRSSPGRVETELLLKKRKGRTFPVQLSSTPTDSMMKDGALLYQTAIVDLTERKAVEAALRAKQAELDLIVTQTPFMLARCSRDLHYRYVSRAYAEMLGRVPEEIAGKSIVEIIGKKALAAIRPHIKAVLSGQSVAYETMVHYPDGQPRYLHGVYVPDKNEPGEVIGWIASLIDITEQKQAADALQEAKALLERRVKERTAELRSANKKLENEIERRRGLEGEILEVSDREQQRLGQELHDGLCQHLTAIAFMARATARRLKDHRVLVTEDIEKIAQLVNDAANDARNLARGLHRVDATAADFVRAMQDLVDRELWQTPCRLEVKRSFCIEDDAVAAHLFRIAREAVINANKHAQAHEIVIKLDRSREGVVLSVSDDGLGLPDELDRKRGLGFHIMRYRAQEAGGRLEVESRKQGGTRIACSLPN